ncbi:MAG TPA: thioredoxin family protein [Chitinophagaceae bacterium]|nr:thioredoxin family protein [Chitinophagaceae bacterium]
MKFSEYLELFKLPATEAELSDPHSHAHFTKLNDARIHRWINHGVLSDEIKQVMSQIQAPQKWVLITETWCGDAAHLVPFIYLISQLSSQVTLEVQIRDTDSEINQYLTNGAMAIPKLIIRDESGADIAVWGPRPETCHAYFVSLKEQGMDIDAQKLELQKWYNADKGVSIQAELCQLVSKINERSSMIV